jgi:hypothetical protein
MYSFRYVDLYYFHFHHAWIFFLTIKWFCCRYIKIVDFVEFSTKLWILIVELQELKIWKFLHAHSKAHETCSYSKKTESLAFYIKKKYDQKNFNIKKLIRIKYEDNLNGWRTFGSQKWLFFRVPKIYKFGSQKLTIPVPKINHSSPKNHKFRSQKLTNPGPKS